MKRVGLSLLFAFGALVGLSLAIPILLISLVRGARTVHARGTVYETKVTALDGVVGPRIAGPAVVRLSGAAMAEDSTEKDILGLELRLRTDAAADADLTAGDQDIVFGTFESFLTVGKDKERVDPNDYLHNEYSSVTPWRVREVGVAHLRLMPPPAGDPARASTRTARLDVDIAAGRAVFTMEVRTDDKRTPVAKVELVGRLPVDGAALRVSMFRTARGLVPTGFRNGIRAVVYPFSQTGRRLRGG